MILLLLLDIPQLHVMLVCEYIVCMCMHVYVGVNMCALVHMHVQMFTKSFAT